jgi:hypothetical protein
VLRACCHAHFASRTHAGIAASKGSTFASAPLPRVLMKHLQHKSICCNMHLK